MHDAQQLDGIIALEVADRRAGEVDHVLHRHHGRRWQIERPCEIRNHRVHGDVRKFTTQALRRHVKVIRRNIDWYVSRKLVQMLQQDSGLETRTTAKFDQAGLWTDQYGHLVNRLAHDLELGVGQVVLGQLGDLLEQLRATLVVEILRRDRLLRSAKSLDDFDHRFSHVHPSQALALRTASAHPGKRNCGSSGGCDLLQ